MRFRSERLSEASVALKSIREKGGHPVPLSDRLGGQGRHGGVVGAGMSAGTESLDSKLSPLIPMCK